MTYQERIKFLRIATIKDALSEGLSVKFIVARVGHENTNYRASTQHATASDHNEAMDMFLNRLNFAKPGESAACDWASSTGIYDDASIIVSFDCGDYTLRIDAVDDDELATAQAMVAEETTDEC